MATGETKALPLWNAAITFRLPAGATVPVRLDRPLFKIGRRESSDVCLADLSVSNTHAQISFIHGCWTLQDLHSRNGVYVNGYRKALYALKDGDVGRVGSVTFRFEGRPPGPRDQETTVSESGRAECCKCTCPVSEEDLQDGSALRVTGLVFCRECRHPLLGHEFAGHKILDILDPIGPVLVFRGLHVASRTHRALKVFAEDTAAAITPMADDERVARGRFLRESMCLERLDHPGIIRVHEAGVWEHRVPHGAAEVYLQTPWFSMEFVDGENVQRTVSGQGPLGPRKALDVARQAAEALEYAAGRGVVHRDIRPANLLVRKDGVVKVIDFGVALVAGSTRITQPRSVVGVPGYMAPEQVEDPRTADQRADIFSLGATLFFALTGERPIEADTLLSYVSKLRKEPMPRLKDALPAIPSELDAVVARMMAKDPAARTPNWGEVRADLKRASTAAGELETAHDIRVGWRERK